MLDQFRFIDIDYMSPKLVAVVFTNTKDAALKSLLERVLYVKHGNNFDEPPRPVRAIFESSLQNQRDRLIKSLSSGEAIKRFTDDQMIAESAPPKRRRMRKVIEQFSGRVDTPLDAHVHGFVKTEKLVPKSGVKHCDVVPRSILPRTKQFNYYLGRYTKPLEEKMYDSIDELFGYQVVAKHLNQEQRAELLRKHWLSFKDPWSFSSDAKRYDEHHSQQSLKFEDSLYLSQFHGEEKRELRRLLSYQHVNKIRWYTRDGYKLAVTVKGRRMTGDVNTSLGNITIMCVLVHKFLQSLGFLDKVKVVNDGDDTVFIGEHEDLLILEAAYPGFMLNYGFEMALENLVHVFEEIQFCQSHPVWAFDRWTMVRNVLKSLCCDPIMLNHRSMKFNEWLTCVSVAGSILCSGVPIMQSFYRCLDNNHSIQHIQKLYDKNYQVGLFWLANLSNGEARKFQEITRESRISFYKAFGILPSQQISCEKYYDNFTVCGLPSGSMGRSQLQLATYESQYRHLLSPLPL